VNFEILMSKDRKNCLCTAMLYDAEQKKEAPKEGDKKYDFGKKSKILERLNRIKQTVFLDFLKPEKTNRS
jgi:hypothetical protein